MGQGVEVKLVKVADVMEWFAPLRQNHLDAIDLDDGVLVNYNKFGQAIKEVKGLNDKKTKTKVRQFDWIDTTTIR